MRYPPPLKTTMYAEAAGICGNGHELTGVPISVSSYHHPIYIQKSPFYLSAHKSSSLMTPWCGFTMYAEAAGICGNGHELDKSAHHIKKHIFMLNLQN